jgi:hypothetical protein
MKYNYSALAKNIPWLVVLIYIILKPFYVFNLGMPQVAEYFIMIILVFHYIHYWPVINLKNKSLVLVWSFLLLITVINATYAVYFTMPEALTFWKSTIFYGFNVLFFIFCKRLFNIFNPKDYRWLLIACFVSMLIQFVLYLMGFDKEVTDNFFGRRHFYFNNPNQLAYYCLLIVTLILLVEKKIRTLRFLIPLLISLACVFTFFSSSRPVILGLILLVIYYFVFVLKEQKVKNTLLFLLPLLFVFSIHFQKSAHEFNRTFSRFERVEVNPTKEYSGRGMERILENPMNLLFGAGEGYLERFITPKNKLRQEIHNTAANLLFSYGIAGFLLFTMFLYFSLRYLSMKQLCLFIPLFLYNMFHNGIRFSFLWLFLAMAIHLNEERRQVKILA